MGVLHRLQKAGVHRGVLGGNRAWTAIAIGSFTMRQVAKHTRRRSEVVHFEELKPGESILISHTTEIRG